MSRTTHKALADRMCRWEKEYEEARKKVPPRRPKFETVSGLEIKPLYTPVDMPEQDYLQESGFPGEYPFTRGIHHTMYRSQLWKMRQILGYGTPKESREMMNYIYGHEDFLASWVLDTPTGLGLDSDDPRAKGGVGQSGVPIDSLRDVEEALADISLDRVSLSINNSPTGFFMIPMLIAAADKKGIPRARIRGSIHNDPLSQYPTNHLYILPVEPAVRLAVDAVEYCCQHLPLFNPLVIGGQQMRDSGCNAIQEIAFPIANGITYVQALVDRGLNIDDFAPRLSFQFRGSNDFFEEIAKYRAFRRVWAKTMKTRFGARHSRSMAIRFHAQTSGIALTAQQPLNNIIRTTMHTLAAVLGGAQSIGASPYDESLGLPTREAIAMAFNIQQVIAEETGVEKTIDPLGGSYFIEDLTNRLEKAAWDYIERIDAMGGAIKALNNGFIQSEIAKECYRYHDKIASGEESIVGVNKFRLDTHPAAITVFEVDPELEKTKIANLTRLRKERDNEQVAGALQKLRVAAESKENLMPVMIDTVKAYATVGEISMTLKQIFGEFHETFTF